MAAEVDYRATTGDATGAAYMSEATDSVATDKPVADTAENPNADQTAADGL